MTYPPLSSQRYGYVAKMQEMTDEYFWQTGREAYGAEPNEEMLRQIMSSIILGVNNRKTKLGSK